MGGEIKLFFVLYLPQRLKENINLLPRLQVTTAQTHTEMHQELTKPHSPFRSRAASHMLLQTRWRCTDSRSDCVQSEVSQREEEGRIQFQAEKRLDMNRKRSTQGDDEEGR